jgi:molecular chaperone GrpE (heat shock protein)
VEAEFVAMTESVNEVNAAVKLQESIALAAKEQYLRSTADFENFRKRSVGQSSPSLKCPAFLGLV